VLQTDILSSVMWLSRSQFCHNMKVPKTAHSKKMPRVNQSITVSVFIHFTR